MSRLNRMYQHIDETIAALQHPDPILDSIVRADATHIAHLVLEGLTAEADTYATDPTVASRIRRWKETRV
jgi:hypothetical protein